MTCLLEEELLPDSVGTGGETETGRCWRRPGWLMCAQVSGDTGLFGSFPGGDRVTAVCSWVGGTRERRLSPGSCRELARPDHVCVTGEALFSPLTDRSAAHLSRSWRE